MDFQYDGKKLSDFGFVICDFNWSTGTSIIDIGSKITFNKIPMNMGKNHSLVSAKYEECIQTTFDICKNPDVYDYKDMVITADEYKNIIRWLNRREFLKFNVIDDTRKKTETCYYNASFNVSKIMIGGVIYGIQLAMETDKPFGYGDVQVFLHNFTSTAAPYSIEDSSDEIGLIYPDIKITCRSDGDLQIRNESTGCTCFIKNCKTGEVITMYGESGIILTSYNSHDICDDFNYTFLNIGNTIDDRNNTISVSIPCDIEIRYCPIIKDSL